MSGVAPLLSRSAARGPPGARVMRVPVGLLLDGEEHSPPSSPAPPPQPASQSASPSEYLCAVTFTPWAPLQHCLPAQGSYIPRTSFFDNDVKMCIYIYIYDDSEENKPGSRWKFLGSIFSNLRSEPCQSTCQKRALLHSASALQKVHKIIDSND